LQDIDSISQFSPKLLMVAKLQEFVLVRLTMNAPVFLYQ